MTDRELQDYISLYGIELAQWPSDISDRLSCDETQMSRFYQLREAEINLRKCSCHKIFCHIPVNYQKKLLKID